MMDHTPKPLNTLQDLHDELSALDDEMRKNGVPPHARMFRAWRDFCLRRGLALNFRPTIEDPSPDDLSLGALTAHISNWFKQRYDTRSRIVYSPSIGVIDIDGDRLRMSVPMIQAGQVDVEINPARLGYRYRRIARSPRSLKDNLLNLLDGMTQQYANSLPPSAYAAVAEQAALIISVYNEMSARLANTLVKEAAVDLDSGALALMDGVSQGHARWSFLQAAEKSIKALLQFDGVPYDKYFKAGHNLYKLQELSTKLKGSKVMTSAVIDAVLCEAKVRYGEIPSSPTEAMAAYRNSLLIIREALKGIATQRRFGAAIYPGPFPDGHFDAIADCVPPGKP
ncbi:hypothetical protein [Mesorhizobium sp. M1D.F.Ca.ET.043.01.1.1]|uniref:hypothetical protein n=1 Tax=Mesorhizobium sp. M1D.F.Ca.ET.043.01.1.1 TaxID=2493669 RepID=UPI000F758350|nr:hypothetical protein [Mesorhizobium sp. M1D.F.Ca.ET.043.01.1.1]AZO69957.1 hypothetical protein EJ067_01225 [Mesorhizobium sp. M1D.F.Ca.ET.043.01.1.1]